MSSSVTNNNKNEIFPSNGENINNFLTADCMLQVFRSSDRYPAPLALVCKAWHQALEHSYPWIANFYREDEHITPLYSLVMTAGGQVDTKETVKQTYFRIMEFIDTRHIQKALQKAGLQVVTPLTPSLGPILNVAREANLVKSFQRIFRHFAQPQNAAVYPHFQQAFVNSCNAADIHPSSFKVGPTVDNPIRPSLASKALCVHLFIQNSPEILNQKELPIKIITGNITAVPREVCLFLNITTLYFSYNQLTTLPDAIGQLSKLTTLCLNNNELTTLPETLCNLSKLEVLNLEYNELTELPETLCLLSKLKNINLGNNQLTHLPQFIYKLTNLVITNIVGNKINTTEFPAISRQLSSLQQFNIRHFEFIHNINKYEECSIQ
jgi:hypothetical protein